MRKNLKVVLLTLVLGGFICCDFSAAIIFARPTAARAYDSLNILATPTIPATPLLSATSTSTSAHGKNTRQRQDVGPFGFLSTINWHDPTIVAAFITAIAAFITALSALLGLFVTPWFTRRLNQKDKRTEAKEQEAERQIKDSIELYRDRLQRDLEHLKIQVQKNETEIINIGTDYIPLRARLMPKDPYNLPEKLCDVDTLIFTRQCELRRRINGYDSYTIHQDNNVLNLEPQGCMIIAGAGKGKTFLLKRLAWQMLTNPTQTATGILPICIQLKKFAWSSRNKGRISIRKSNSLLVYIADMLEEEYNFPHKHVMDFVNKSWNAGKILLLLDGLDETLGKEHSDAANKNYQRVLRSISSLPSTLCRIVITARDGIEWTPNNFARLTLEDFTPDDIYQATQNLYDKQQKSFEATKLTALLENMPRLQAFASTPYGLMHFLHRYQKSSGMILRDRTGLYQNYIDNQPVTWNKSKTSRLLRRFIPFGNASPYPGIHHCVLTKEETQNYLGYIAWRFQGENRYIANKDDITRFIREYRTAYWPNKVWEITPDEIFKEFCLKDGLLRQTIKYDGQFEFPSITLQEYLAATHVAQHGVAKNSLIDTLFDHRSDPRWEEVIALFIQIASNSVDISVQNLVTNLVARLKQSTWPPADCVAYTDLVHLVQSLAINQPSPIYDEIKIQLYGTFISSLPMFIQELIAIALYRLSIVSLEKDALESILQSNTATDPLYATLSTEMRHVVDKIPSAEAVSPLFLSMLIGSTLTTRNQLLSFENEGELRIRELLLTSNIDDHRIRIICALIIKGKKSWDASPMLYRLLSSQPTLGKEVHRWIAKALGILGDKSWINTLSNDLENRSISIHTRWYIVRILGMFGRRNIGMQDTPQVSSISNKLLGKLRTLQDNNKESEYLRWNIATTLIHCLCEDKELVIAKFREGIFSQPLIEQGISVLENTSIPGRMDDFLTQLSNTTLTLEECLWITEILTLFISDETVIDRLKSIWLQSLLSPAEKQTLAITTQNIVGSLQTTWSQSPLSSALKESVLYMEWTVIRRAKSERA